MNPQELFCPNMDCPARGQVKKGNIHIHSQKDKRCICEVCGQTFTTTKGTIFYRLRSDPQLVMRINPLTRRTRTLAQRAETLLTGIYIVGCFYNFCDFHHSLRLKLSVGSFDHLWVQRTPAIASGLTDHQWTPAELLNFKIPPSHWDLPKQRGRPSTILGTGIK